MKQPRDGFFLCTSFTDDQHGYIRLRQQFRLGANLVHLGSEGREHDAFTNVLDVPLLRGEGWGLDRFPGRPGKWNCGILWRDHLNCPKGYKLSTL
jgi:hypothetical protein